MTETLIKDLRYLLKQASEPHPQPQEGDGGWNNDGAIAATSQAIRHNSWACRVGKARHELFKLVPALLERHEQLVREIERLDRRTEEQQRKFNFLLRVFAATYDAVTFAHSEGFEWPIDPFSEPALAFADTERAWDFIASGMEAATAGETSTQIEGSTEGASPARNAGTPNATPSSQETPSHE